MSKWEFFTDDEVRGLKDDLMQKLVAARKKTIELDPQHVGVKFVITSGYRSPEENKFIVGAVQDSAHTTGLAVDLRCSGSRERFLMVSALLFAGFNRLGLYDKHIHCDVDASKVDNQYVIWTGTSH